MPGGGLQAELGFGLGDFVETPWPPKLDHDTLRKRLLAQFRQKPMLNAVLGAFLRGTQDVEDTLYAMMTESLPPDAEGAQLDQLGAQRVVDREDRSDAAYLAVQEAWAAARRSEGVIEEIYAVLEAAAGAPDGNPRVEDLHADPASLLVRLLAPPLELEPGSPDPLPAELVGRMIAAAVAGGVRVWFEWVPVEPADWLVMVDTYSTVPSTHGLSDSYESPTFGGYLSGMRVVA